MAYLIKRKGLKIEIPETSMDVISIDFYDVFKEVIMPWMNDAAAEIEQIKRISDEKISANIIKLGEQDKKLEDFKAKIFKLQGKMDRVLRNK